VLIAFEGGEATGKSTQASLLARRLGERCLLTREPGATPVGASIRALLLDADGAAAVGARTEALLMAADRAQHVADVVRPALEAGRIVVTDRYIGSSLAYQGHGRGLPVDDVAAVSAFATDGLDADIVVLLTVPAAVRAERLQSRSGAGLDRLEREGDGFHDRVEAGFGALAAADPARWTVVDGAGDVDDVHVRVWAAVAPHLDR
jgi:dTMP kinase